MNFYNSGYGYERSDEGYVISHGQAPSKRNNGYVDVWSAWDGLPPNGRRIANGGDDFFTLDSQPSWRVMSMRGEQHEQLRRTIRTQQPPLWIRSGYSAGYLHCSDGVSSGAGGFEMTYLIDDERHWRISKSGFSIKTGWSDDKRVIAKYPGLTHPLDPKMFTEWMDNAEKICELYNASLPPRECGHNWVSAVNEVVKSGEVCTSCGAIRA